jgi:hypothetical protein
MQEGPQKDREGHDFSRAVRVLKIHRALAPEESHREYL